MTRIGCLLVFPLLLVSPLQAVGQEAEADPPAPAVSQETVADTLAAAAAQDAAAAPSITRLPVTAGRIAAEQWTFRIVEDGEPAGRIVVEFFPGDDVVWIHDRSTMEPGVDEDVMITLDPATLQFRANAVSGDFNGVHVNGSYRREGDRVQGLFVQHRLSDGAMAESPVDVAWPDAAILRGAAIWLAHTVEWKVGDEYRFPWFTALGGRFEDVRYHVPEALDVTVPAGTYSTFLVVQEGGTPGNVIYVTRDAPHRTVRVDVVGRPMTIELESVREAAAPPGD